MIIQVTLGGMGDLGFTVPYLGLTVGMAGCLTIQRYCPG